MEQKELVPGLAGIPAAESAISYIDGQAGVLEYRGHRIESLAEQSTFEEVAWLLLYGALPTRDELATFKAEVAAMRDLPEVLIDIVRAFPKTAHPMDALQCSLAALGMVSPPVDFRDSVQADGAIRRILGATGMLIATFERSRRGQDYLAPDPSLGTAANFLYMLNGEQPSGPMSRVLDVALILHADHTMNASTFAARVVASTESDPYTVCSAAVGALHGALHGGANERVLEQLEAIGGPEAAATWLDAQLASKSKVMGFGHRVYKTKDPRATALQGLVHDVFAAHGSTPNYDTALALEGEVVARLGSKGIHPNVDFFSGIVYQKLGIATDAFTPVFALARVAGWLAHWREQMQDNKLFRPGQIYVGVHDAVYTPIDER
ncbi:MAG: citrate synthase [Planctomycetota bacterium]|nr:MAG: citrate synthase [Planctomycetota bacterium]